MEKVDYQALFEAAQWLCFSVLGAAWSILGAISDQTGRQGVPKIELFWHYVVPKPIKIMSMKGSQKKLDNLFESCSETVGICMC